WVPHLAPQPLAGSLHTPPPDYVWEPVAQTVLTRSSEIHEALATHQQAQALLRRARAEVVPNVTLGVRPFYSFPEQDKRLEFEISFPIPVFNRNQGNIYSAQADVIRTQEDVRLIELRLQERLAAAFQRYQVARQQVDVFRLQILPNAERSLQLVQLGYSRGDPKYGYLLLLQAQRTLAQAELAYVQALGELWRSATEIAGLLQE